MADVNKSSYDGWIIPEGYQTLHDAIECAGKAVYPNGWTGEERKYSFRTSGNAPKMVFSRSDLERSYFALVHHEARKYEEKIRREVIDDTVEENAKDNNRLRDQIFLKLQTNKKHRADKLIKLSGIDEKTREPLIENGVSVVYDRFVMPSVEDIQLAAWGNKDTIELGMQVSEMIDRRSHVERVCRDAIYSTSDDVPPRCLTYYIDPHGRPQAIEAGKWGTPQGLKAIEAQSPGFYSPNDDSFKAVVLLKIGDLCDAVIKMRDGEKTLKPVVSKDTEHKDGKAAGEWLAAEIRKGDPIGLKSYYINRMVSDHGATPTYAGKLWCVETRGHHAWTKPGPRKGLLR